MVVNLAPMSTAGDKAKQVRLKDERYSQVLEIQADNPEFTFPQLVDMALARGLPILKMGLRALKKAGSK